MTTISTYEKGVQARPINRQEVSVNTSAESFGAGVGRAVEGASQQLYKVADAAIYRQQLVDDAKADESLNGYRDQRREVLMDPITGALNQTGANGMGVRESSAERMRKAREKAAEGLTGRALNRFNKQADDWDADAQDRMISHEAQETKSYILTQHGAMISGYIEDAAGDWGNQASFDKNLAAAVAEQERLGVLQGWDAQTQQNKREELTSTAIRQRLLIAADADPTQALAIYEASTGSMTAKDKYEVGQMLEPIVLDAQASAFVQGFVNPGGADLSAYAVEGATRADALTGLKPDFSSSVGQMFADAPPEIREALRIGSAYRSEARQAELWADALVKYGSPEAARKWVAPPGKSQHGHGQAMDLKYASPEAKAWVHANAEKYGLHFPLGNEDWHIEPIGARGEAVPAGNGDQIKAAGFAVSPVSEYAWRQFGASGGASLLKAAETNPAMSAEKAFGIEWPGILKANPQFKGKTAGEIVDYIAASAGAGSGTGKPHFDVQGAYAAAMAITDPKLQAEAFKRVSAMMAMQNNVGDQTRQDTQKAAWDEYVATGKTDLSVQQRQDMGQAGWVAFQATVEKDQLGVDMTDPDTHEELTRMASSDTKAFAELNLAARYSELSRADRRAMVELQEAARAKLRGDALTIEQKRLTIDYGKHYDAAKPVYEAMVPDAATGEKQTQEQKKQRLDFQQQLTTRIQEFYDKESREPNAMEVAQMATVLTLPARIYQPGGSLFGNDQDLPGTNFFEGAMRPDGSRMEITMKYEDVPIDARANLAQALTVQNGGVPPTPEQITDAYEWQLQLDQGIAPAVDIKQVPPDVVAVMREIDPASTDEDIVAAFQASLLANGISGQGQ